MRLGLLVQKPWLPVLRHLHEKYLVSDLLLLRSVANQQDPRQPGVHFFCWQLYVCKHLLLDLPLMVGTTNIINCHYFTMVTDIHCFLN